jgi:predicted nucleic acid-binding Zn finger protein
VSHGDGDPPDEPGSGEMPEATEGSGGCGPSTGASGGPDASDPDSDVDDPDRPAGDTDPGRDGYAVPTVSGSDAETVWLRALADAGELTPGAVDALLSRHDDRGGRAIEAVSEGRVKQYRDFTVVVGHEDEYVVEAGGCTCKDSAYNLDPDDPDDRCWHVLAVAIAERIDEVDHHRMWYSEVREFL